MRAEIKDLRDHPQTIYVPDVRSVLGRTLTVDQPPCVGVKKTTVASLLGYKRRGIVKSRLGAIDTELLQAALQLLPARRACTNRLLPLCFASVRVLKAVKTAFRARPASRTGSREPSPKRVSALRLRSSRSF
jgi:hypothetical protein